jgi:hypothetical protein
MYDGLWHTCIINVGYICKNKRGPSTEPCGTPDKTWADVDFAPSSTTFWFQFSKNDLIHVTVLWLTP